MPSSTAARAPIARALHAAQASRCAPDAHPPPLGPGSGRLVAERIGEETVLTTCTSTTPLRLLAPRMHGPSTWVLGATHGGGLVAGDEVSVEIDVAPGARLYLGTQAETKVYRSSRGRVARQALRARIGSGGLLAVLPEPVSPYQAAAFEQRQAFELSDGAGLALLDAVTAGRVARGERWAFTRCTFRNDVAFAGRTALADGLRLVSGEGPPLAARLDGVELLATLVLLGRPVEDGARALHARVAAMPADDGAAAVLAAASPLAGGALVRVAARTVEAGMAFVREALAFLAGPLGGDPLSRRP